MSTPATPSLVRIAVAGALGRMGVTVAGMVREHPGLVLAARFDRPDATGEGLVSQDEALAACDVVIDFSTPEATTALARTCAARGGPALVVGTTGLDEGQIAAIDAAANQVAIIRTGNFSLGVNMLIGLVAQAAKALPADVYDAEVFEAHHRRKVDAPSGTALMLGEAIAEARGVSLAQMGRRARDGITGARPTGEIGFSVMRAGGIIGEHSVVFASDEETVTLAHSARDRSLFARGAVAGARWLAGRPPGLYDMQDVLGFTGRG